MELVHPQTQLLGHLEKPQEGQDVLPTVQLVICLISPIPDPQVSSVKDLPHRHRTLIEDPGDEDILSRQV